MENNEVGISVNRNPIKSSGSYSEQQITVEIAVADLP
jgi:hypothetical protein